MDSFQRVSEALNHREADKVPFDLGGMTVSSISSVLLKKVLEYYGIPVDFTSPDPIQRIGEPPQELKALLGFDTMRIGLKRVEQPTSIKPWEQPKVPITLTDLWHVTWEMRPEDHYFNQKSYPLQEGELSEAVGRFSFPEPDGTALARCVHTLLSSRGQLFPVLDRDCAGIFEMSQRLRKMDFFMMDLVLDRKGAEALADKVLAYKIAYWDGMLSEIGDEVVVVAEADDYGSDQGLLIAPNLVREIYLSRLASLISHIKKRAPHAKICFHSCGAVRPIIPDLIEAGVDILNPVQYIASGMDLKGLKKDFGNDIVFWGGCIDTTRILPYGTPLQVREEVQRVLDILAPGGGFVAAPVHNIQSDVPLENVVALFDTVQEYRNY